MSTFCPKCGTAIPDGTFACPMCQTPVAAAPQAQPQQPVDQAPVAPQQQFQQPAAQAPQAPYPQQQYPQQQYPQQPYPQQGYPQQPYPGYGYPAAPVPAVPSQNKPDTNFGQFFKDFFESPTDTLINRATVPNWLIGLLSMGLFAILEFFIQLIEYDSNMKYISKKYSAASMSFCTLLTDIFALASLILLVMIFSSLFKVKKLDFLSSVSVAGISMIFAFPCTLVAYLNTKLVNAIDKDRKFISISSSITVISTVFISIALYAFAKHYLEEQGNKKKITPIWFSICTIASYSVAATFFGWLFSKIFFG